MWQTSYDYQKREKKESNVAGGFHSDELSVAHVSFAFSTVAIMELTSLNSPKPKGALPINTKDMEFDPGLIVGKGCAA